MKKVIVASKNPVKINAVKLGFEKVFPEEAFTFEGVNVSSGVADQPFSEAETIRGARNRVENALQSLNGADY